MEGPTGLSSCFLDLWMQCSGDGGAAQGGGAEAQQPAGGGIDGLNGSKQLAEHEQMCQSFLFLLPEVYWQNSSFF